MKKQEKNPVLESALEKLSHSEVGALVEDFQHKLAVVAEGVIILNEKFDRMEKRADENEYALRSVRGDLVGVHGVIENHEERICELEAV